MKFFTNANSGKNDWFLYIAMLLILFLASQFGGMPLYYLLNKRIREEETLGTEELNAFMANPDFALFDIGSNLGFFLLLLSFVVPFIVLWLVFQRLHARPFKSLISYTSKIDWKRILFGFGFWLILVSIAELFLYFSGLASYEFHFRPETFFYLLLLSLLILPLQTSLEELLFRSYLMQGIGLATKSKWISLIVTSILFGAIHLGNPEIEKFGVVNMLFYYIGAGFFLGLITVLDDRLELALGVHAATNFMGAVILGYDGAAIQTDSLFTTDLNPILSSILFYSVAIIFVLTCYKIYNWPSLKTLFVPIDLKNENLT